MYLQKVSTHVSLRNTGRMTLVETFALSKLSKWQGTIRPHDSISCLKEWIG